MKKGKVYSSLKSIYLFFMDRIVINILLFHYGKYQHQKKIAVSKRSQTHTYTSFYRSPGQLKLLSETIVKHLSPDLKEPLKIAVFAGSNGSEAYTIASHLMKTLPELKFQIVCSDLHSYNVEHAKHARYGKAKVISVSPIPRDFITFTFDEKDEDLVVKSNIAEKIEFLVADLLDPDLVEKFEKYDIVFLQNVLFHLEQGDAKAAFNNVIKVLKPKSALFIDGMELEMKEQLTGEHNLNPVAERVGEIYRYSRLHFPRDWWNYYYGNEPLSIFNFGNLRRFSTVFLKE